MPEMKTLRIGSGHLLFFLAIAVVFVVWMGLRFYAFWLPHWKGDQGHYISLAMKLERGGLDAYNLRGVDVRFANFGEDTSLQFVFPELNPKSGEGTLLLVLKNVGQGYYDEPLHMRAPLFSYVLIKSHDLFMGRGKPYLVCSSNLGEAVTNKRPLKIFKIQFWAAVVPLFFNFGVIVLTLFFGVTFFSPRTGLYAAFLMSTNAVSLMTSYRLLSEDLCLFFIMLSFFVFLWAHSRRNLLGVAVSGVFAGLAILTKQTAGLVLAIAWVYTFFVSEIKNRSVAGFLKSVFNASYLIYAASVFLVSGFWFIKVFRVYGHPLHTPATGMALSAGGQDISGWFRAVNMRPNAVFFFSVGVIFLCPVFSLTLFTFNRFRRQVIDAWKSRGSGDVLFFWVWILVFYTLATQPWHLLTVGFNQEHRYFYPAYPPIALLSAFVLDRLRQKIASSSRWTWAGDTIIVLLLAWNAQTGVSKAMSVLFSNNMLL